mmetsp:Transcript_6163/g.14318  ORF Transcript_6163/g.14318 Transcript_6163/m.14318 type:complete len:87 (-) Transcript_6163:1374-1634(-)
MRVITTQVSSSRHTVIVWNMPTMYNSMPTQGKTARQGREGKSADLHKHGPTEPANTASSKQQAASTEHPSLTRAGCGGFSDLPTAP